ncbi:NAD(P)/FAD-dependent oxidoreductase [Niveispirillum sp. KHB5.9]|uniref:NAD(P)/FAD-dependent oxidoreductase n=1 Tax=Niveispirillum sp. KHB5.9 TaxID=3400269 RepID=UPI003A884695
MNTHYDIIIAGGGAAGLYAAIFAGRRGRRVLVIDHAEKVGKKILISGGGRCNFTNLDARPDRYLSANPHFCISALKRHTQHDFIGLVERHGIGWHEKKLGQLFCDDGAGRILGMLLDECADAGVEIRTSCHIDDVAKGEGGFSLTTSQGSFTSDSFILATGGPSIPKMGATDFAFILARKWGLSLVEPRPALVPLTFAPAELEKLKDLSGVPLEATVSCGKGRFREALLITHRGLSGPSILQISSYWRPEQGVAIDLSPDLPLAEHLKGLKRTRHKAELKTVLGELLPRRFAERLFETALIGPAPLISRPMADLKDADLMAVAAALHAWTVHPDGTEGYRTAEVTLGGVDTAELSSKTMEAKKIPGLYVVGEAVDVTGWLGGYNFQWAWSSGHAAGMAA